MIEIPKPNLLEMGIPKQKVIELEPKASLKKCFFGQVLINLGLPKSRVIKLWPHDHIYNII